MPTDRGAVVQNTHRATKMEGSTMSYVNIFAHSPSFSSIFLHLPTFPPISPHFPHKSHFPMASQQVG